MPGNSKQIVDDSKNTLLDSEVNAGRDVQIGDKIFQVNLKLNFIWLVALLITVLLFIKLTYKPKDNSNTLTERIDNRPNQPVLFTDSLKNESTTKSLKASEQEESAHTKPTQPAKAEKKVQTLGVRFFNTENSFQQTFMSVLGEQFQKYNLNLISVQEELPFDLELRSKVSCKRQEMELGRSSIKVDFTLNLTLFDPNRQEIVNTFSKSSDPFFVHAEKDSAIAFEQWLDALDLARQILPRELL